MLIPPRSVRDGNNVPLPPIGTPRRAPGGVLYYEDRLPTTESVDYGPSDRRRLGANELLRACLDLTVLHYREFTDGGEDHRGAHAQVIARNSSGATQPHPHREILDD